MERIKLVISDCHLSAGLNFESRRNPHEDFLFDDEMCAFFKYFSTGKYGAGWEVELILNGDYLDFLNVPYKGEFEEVITEEFALYKLECILKGHPKVVDALREFAALPDKSITYNIGNHDADLFFPRVREHLIRALDPQGEFPSAKVRINYETPIMNRPGGVQIHHGNQFESVHVFNYAKPLLTEGLPHPVLNIPWGSFYVLKIVNRFKWEREYIDKVKPVKGMILWGLFFDTAFILKFIITSVFYFFKTRFIYSPKRRSRLLVTVKILKEQTTTFLQDLEGDARKLLDDQPSVHTIIMGHTHIPMEKGYPDGKTYINTGTWTRMISLDIGSVGTGYRLTFAFIEYDDSGKAHASLQQWMGEYQPHRHFIG